jgi:hypothetical protein
MNLALQKLNELLALRLVLELNTIITINSTKSIGIQQMHITF